MKSGWSPEADDRGVSAPTGHFPPALHVRASGARGLVAAVHPAAMPPSFVYFDLDDTLLDHSAAERNALADVHAGHAEHLGHIPLGELHATYRRHNGPLWRDYGRGQITKEELKRLRFANTLGALGVTALDPDAASGAYLERYAAHWDWAAGAREAFRRVADALPVGILTNGFREQQRAKLARLPEIADRCEAGAVLIAEEIGAWKPTPEAFAMATERAGVAPEAVLYVGDSFYSDVVGGTAAGWRVVWWNGDPAHEEHGALAASDWGDVLRLAGLAPEAVSGQASGAAA